MLVELNGSTVETSRQTLEALLSEHHFESSCVATAVNGMFVARGARASTLLSDGAKVEVVSPMQGG